MKRAVREEKKSKHLTLREFLQQYRDTPHCTTGRTPAELMLGHQVRSSLSVLQPRAHKTKLQKKSTSPAKPKLTIGAHVHYRDYTRNRPKWVAGKVTGHVGNKMFTVQGPDGHCRRHEDQLKLRSVPKLNRQRRLSRPLQSTVHVIQRWISSHSTTVFQNVLFISPTRSRMKNCLFSFTNLCCLCYLCYLVVRLVSISVFHQSDLLPSE